MVITNLAGGDVVWIGLHREKQWSDGSPSLFRYWAQGQPDSGEEECVTMAFNNSGLWSDDNCLLSFPFICYITSNVPSIVYFCSHSIRVRHIAERHWCRIIYVTAQSWVEEFNFNKKYLYFEVTFFSAEVNNKPLLHRNLTQKRHIYI